MTTIDWILATYLAIAVLVFFRMMFVGRQIAAKIGMPFEFGKFFSAMFWDSVRWPYFVLWFGLKSFLKDLSISPEDFS